MPARSFTSDDSPLSDGELQLLSPRDQSAVWALWSRYHKQVELVVRGIPALTSWDREEVISGTAVRFGVQLPRHAPAIRDLPAWLRTMARNEARTLLRRRWRSRILYVALNSGENPEGAAQNEQAASPVGEIEKRERSEALCVAFQSLSEKLRKTAFAYLIQERSYEEIAHSERIPQATVRKRVQVARARLQEFALDYLEGRRPAVEATSPDLPGIWLPDAPRSFEIESAPGASRILPVPHGRQAAFHHFFFFHRLGREQQRRRALRGYLENHPRGWSRWLELAELNTAAGRWNEALWCYETSRRGGSGSLRSHLGAGELFRALGRADEASLIYREAMAISTDVPARLHLRALMAQCVNHPEEAQRLWREAMAGEPENPAHALAAAASLLGGRRDREAYRLLGVLWRSPPIHSQAMHLALDLLEADGNTGLLSRFVAELFGRGDRSANVIRHYVSLELRRPLSLPEESRLRRDKI